VRLISRICGLIGYSWIFHQVYPTIRFSQNLFLISILLPIFLGVILPVRFMRDKFVALGSMLVLLTLGWIIVVQLESILISSCLLWVSLYLVSIGVSYVLIYRSKRIEEMINSLSERLTILLYAYVPITVLSGVVVILRNV